MHVWQQKRHNMTGWELVNLSICQRWVMLTAHKSRLKSMLVMLNKHKGSLVCRSMPGEENC